jgi:hypothetical protein
MDHVALLDIGKTNAKLSVDMSDGTIVESCFLSVGEDARSIPPKHIFDLGRIGR